MRQFEFVCYGRFLSGRLRGRSGLVSGLRGRSRLVNGLRGRSGLSGGRLIEF
jgi:hypothetical protein